MSLLQTRETTNCVSSRCIRTVPGAEKITAATFRERGESDGGLCQVPKILRYLDPTARPRHATPLGQVPPPVREHAACGEGGREPSGRDEAVGLVAAEIDGSDNSQATHNSPFCNHVFYLAQERKRIQRKSSNSKVRVYSRGLEVNAKVYCVTPEQLCRHRNFPTHSRRTRASDSQQLEMKQSKPFESTRMLTVLSMKWSGDWTSEFFSEIVCLDVPCALSSPTVSVGTTQE